MGRKLLPDGRRTVVGVRLSDAECARLDIVRGGADRAAWCYEMIAAALEASVAGSGTAVVARVRSAAARAPAAGVIADETPVKAKPGRFPCCGHCPRECAGGHTVACRRCPA